MASYISVPRDLSKVKTKVFMNLTKRQILCFGAGALIGVPVFFLLKSSGNLSLAALGMMAVMLPLFFLAMYEKDGQPLEVVAKHFYEATALQNKKLLCTAGSAGRRGNGGKSHCSKFSKS